MRVGFIGVGNIGRPIAGQLLKAGHALTVHDVRREAARSLLDGGATWADSPAAVAGACEVIATCLPGPREMEAVCLGPGGILEGVKPGALYIDHTTTSPLLARRVHGALAAKQVDMLYAPVSGGMEGAEPQGAAPRDASARQLRATLLARARPQGSRPRRRARARHRHADAPVAAL